MNNLILPSPSLLAYNSQADVKSIDVRRQILQIPEVLAVLTRIEKCIFEASTKTQIKDIDASALYTKAQRLFMFIAADVGFAIPTDTAMWINIQSRISNFLALYYSELTLADVKLAFELVITGVLDEYLPKDRNGQPDKHHYQQFNVSYFAKILNAYRNLQNEVIAKAYKALPTPKIEVTQEQKISNDKRRALRNRHVFLQYKYTGRLSFEGCDEMFLYDWLLKAGLADEVKVSESDRKRAFAKYMQRAANGIVNQYTAFYVRREGTSSPELDFVAYDVARRKEIIKAFDRMIAEGMQVDNYVKIR